MVTLAAKERAYKVTPAGGGYLFEMPPRPRPVKAVLDGLASFVGAGVVVVVSFFMFKLGIFLHQSHLILFLVTTAAGFAVRGTRRLAPGQANVSVAGKSLVATGRFGGIRRVRTMELEQIARFEIEEIKARWVRFMGKETQLLAMYLDGRRMVVLENYPRESLFSLAEDLSAFLAVQATIVDVSNVPTAARDVFERPVKSTIVAAQVEDAHTFVVERNRNASSRTKLIVAGLIGLIVGTYLTLMLHGTMMLQPGMAGWLLVLLIVAPIEAIIWLIAARYLLPLTVILIVAPAEDGVMSLTCVSRGLVRSREIHWRREEISKLTTVAGKEDSSAAEWFKFFRAKRIVTLNLTPVMGKTFAMLTGEEMEMRWLATELRRMLGIGYER